MMAHIEEHMEGGVLSVVHEGRCVATAKRGPNGFRPVGAAWLLRLHCAASWIDAKERAYLDRMKINREYAPHLKTVFGKRAARNELAKLAAQMNT